MLAATGQILVVLSDKTLLWFLHCEFSKALNISSTALGFRER